MKTMLFDNRIFWKVTDNSAVRLQDNGRLEILTWNDQEVRCVSRTAPPSIYGSVKQQFEEVSK